MGWFCFLHFHSTKTWIGRYSAFSPPLSMALAFVKSREKSISRPTDGSTLMYIVNTFLYYTLYIGPPTDGSNEISLLPLMEILLKVLHFFWFYILIGWLAEKSGFNKISPLLETALEILQPASTFLNVKILISRYQCHWSLIKLLRLPRQWIWIWSMQMIGSWLNKRRKGVARQL